MLTRVPIKMTCPCGATFKSELVSGFTATVEGLAMAWLNDHKGHKE